MTVERTSLLNRVRAPENQRDSFFSPDSTIWRVNREQILLLGGARALLMQVAHPLVAEAVYDHSYVFQRPVRRLLRTLELTLSLVFGTRDEVLDAARTINHAHHRAKGALSEAAGHYAQGTPYSALDSQLVTWVYATLVEGALSGYERFVGLLTKAEKQDFLDDTRRLVTMLGANPDHLPSSPGDLYAYMDDMIGGGNIVVSRRAKAIAPYVMAQTSPMLKMLTLPSAWLTAGLLPAELRAQYGFAFSAREEKALAAFCRSARRIVPHLPAQARFVVQYRRALRRL